MNHSAFAFYSETLVDACDARNVAKAAEAFQRAAKAGAGDRRALTVLEEKLLWANGTAEPAFLAELLKAAHSALKEYFPRELQPAINTAQMLADLYLRQENHPAEVPWRRAVVELIAKARVPNRAALAAKARYHLVMALSEADDAAGAQAELELLKANGAELLSAKDRAVLLETEATFAASTGRGEEAFGLYSTALELLVEMADTPSQARVLFEMAHIRSEQGRGPESAQLMARFAATSHRAKVEEIEGNMHLSNLLADRCEQQGLAAEAAEHRAAAAKWSAELATIDRGTGALHHLPPGVDSPKENP